MAGTDNTNPLGNLQQIVGEIDKIQEGDQKGIDKFVNDIKTEFAARFRTRKSKLLEGATAWKILNYRYNTGKLSEGTIAIVHNQFVAALKQQFGENDVNDIGKEITSVGVEMAVEVSMVKGE